MKHPIPIVRLILPDEAGRVLILRRADTRYGEGAWCLPGGKVDYGDTVEEAVTRELREETALECTGSRFLFYQDSLPIEAGEMHGINLYFECAATGTLQLNHESNAHARVGPEDIDSYSLVFGNDLGVQRYWNSGTHC